MNVSVHESSSGEAIVRKDLDESFRGGYYEYLRTG